MDLPYRESIGSSIVRTFCKMFFGILGIFIAFLVFSILYSTFSPSPLIEEKSTLSILPDAEGKREILQITTPAILQIPIHGVIGDPQKLDADIMSRILLDSRDELLANNRVKGILLHFNTPGGTVVDSDAIYRMINGYKEKYKIPVFGYVEGLCASGGMYIASAADKIFAGPASIIGSVGVIIGPFFNAYNLMEKVGLQAKTITAGLDKDMLSPTRPWVEGESAPIQAVTTFMYNRFVDVVTKGRPQLNKSNLIQEYGAKVFDCVTAQKLGYVDEAMSSRDEALKALLIAANIEEGHPYQVVSLTPKNPWLSEFVSGKSPLFTGQIKHTFDTIPTHIREQPCYLYRHE
jgi:protease-4